MKKLIYLLLMAPTTIVLFLLMIATEIGALAAAAGRAVIAEVERVEKWSHRA